MAVDLKQSVQQIIDNRFGEGQINIDILNSFLVSQGKSAIIKKRYSSTEKRSFIRMLSNLILKLSLLMNHIKIQI